MYALSKSLLQSPVSVFFATSSFVSLLPLMKSIPTAFPVESNLIFPFRKDIGILSIVLSREAMKAILLRWYKIKDTNAVKMITSNTPPMKISNT